MIRGSIRTPFRSSKNTIRIPLKKVENESKIINGFRSEMSEIGLKYRKYNEKITNLNRDNNILKDLIEKLNEESKEVKAEVKELIDVRG